MGWGSDVCCDGGRLLVGLSGTGRLGRDEGRLGNRTRERDVCGNGVSARDSGTGHQRGSLKKSSVSRRIQPFKVDECWLTQLAG